MEDTNVTVSWWETDYPGKHYAFPSTAVFYGGNPSANWVDVSMFISKPDWLLPADQMVVASDDIWTSRTQYTWVIANGVLEKYTTPAPSLMQQATSVLAIRRTYVSNEFLVYGESVPDSWAAYLKALRAISDGTDTTSTKLPVSPLDASSVVLTPAQKTVAALEALGAYLVNQQTKGFFFTPTGTEVAILFSTSSHAQSQYVGANSLARDNPDGKQNFITNSGAPIVLTASDVIKLTNGVAKYINDTNATYATLVQKVNIDYTTDITVGWPDNKLP